VLVSVRDEDQPAVCEAVRELVANGFSVLATPGTARCFASIGVAVETVPKVGQGQPDVVQRIEAGDVDLVINTVGADPAAARDSASIRSSALLRGIPYFTTAAAARAGVGAIRALQLESIGVRALQDVHAR
jgi:carbamoyl-phosphate synthase large subunit